MPVVDIRDPMETENCYKAAFSTIKSEKIEIVVVLPFSVPDNVV
jgi:hypothetical protein